MIHDKDRILLFHLIQSPTWKIIQNVATEMIVQIQTQPKSGTTLDEIAINAIRSDGQMDGIRRFLQELSTYAHERRGKDNSVG